MIRLNHTALHKIKVHAMQAYPEECCGMLLGKEDGQTKIVCDVIQMKNTKAEYRTRRYLIDPEDYKRAEEQATEEGVSVIGLYHSHPDNPPQPSQNDVEHALPWWSYLIVSVESGLPTTVKSWMLEDDHSSFKEENVEILDGAFKHLWE